MIYDEHPDLVPDGSETCSPDSCKACIELPKRYNGLFSQV